MEKENKIEMRLETYFSQRTEEPRMFELNNRLYIGNMRTKSGFRAYNHVDNILE